MMESRRITGRVRLYTGPKTSAQRDALAGLNAALEQTARTAINAAIGYTGRAVAEEIQLAQCNPITSRNRFKMPGLRLGETPLVAGSWLEPERVFRPTLTIAWPSIRGGSAVTLDAMARAVRLITEWLSESVAPAGLVGYLDTDGRLVFDGHDRGVPFRQIAEPSNGVLTL